MIKVKNLNFSYNSRHILKDVSLQANSGELLGILGANGCGKSTLLKNILGFLKPSSGQILINDTEISKYTPKELANLMSYIPQKSLLTMPLKVLDFILAGRYAKLKNSLFGYQNEDFDIVQEVAERLNVWQHKNRIATTLSGGEFGRVLLARALVNEPKILLLDEPTSAMDLHYAVEILRIVKLLIKNLGLTGVIVIHDLMLASLFCDKIVLMKDGSVMDFGLPSDLIAVEKLQRVYDGLECEIITHNNKPIVVPKAV
ncbi:ATP-binding cassette domain-containing protein [Helicobacter saguini]|uniref:ABC transporter ATP-binding protein n=1 Tax=Helicobacter saguini TaxID=1548018 RepID=A0A099B6P2_9HELI|nr:ABC transporter ATP-binding protein [Helicobacter saguini]MWV62906.1 ATP-binding cassette domain-containing protein [Helicobacter saguini]MWV66424.1 ATP-binding cassette domain-containing protein [Helicobacter saguini]MWV68775.1 ATP-binding cassette domain-containing protein [Helicobacter saguini]MWV71671.1 ATP-binding cassette domain-containing protein [Helicobacter saguini]TLD94472.1 ABC transporter ATP-binding protein [Helicobacter saguini]